MFLIFLRGFLFLIIFNIVPYSHDVLRRIYPFISSYVSTISVTAQVAHLDKKGHTDTKCCGILVQVPALNAISNVYTEGNGYPSSINNLYLLSENARIGT
jgi:hypothetical protein